MRLIRLFVGMVFILLVVTSCNFASVDSVILVGEDILFIMREGNHIDMEYLLSSQEKTEKNFHEILVGTFKEGNLLQAMEPRYLLTFFPNLLFGNFGQDTVQDVRDEYVPILTYKKVRPAFYTKEGSQIEIHSWEDLLRDDVHLVTVNFRTSSIGFFLYLNLWEYALRRSERDSSQAEDFMVQVIGDDTVFGKSLMETHHFFNLYDVGNVLLTVEDYDRPYPDSILIEDSLFAFINLYQRLPVIENSGETNVLSSSFLSISGEEIREQEDFWELAIEVHLSHGGTLSNIFNQLEIVYP